MTERDYPFRNVFRDFLSTSIMISKYYMKIVICSVNGCKIFYLWIHPDLVIASFHPSISKNSRIFSENLRGDSFFETCVCNMIYQLMKKMKLWLFLHFYQINMKRAGEYDTTLFFYFDESIPNSRSIDNMEAPLLPDERTDLVSVNRLGHGWACHKLASQQVLFQLGC